MGQRKGQALIAVIAVLLTGLWSAPALGQTVVAPEGQVYLAPLDDQALFISDTVTTARTFRADIGFDYLQPSFARRSTSLVVPAPMGGSVLGGTDDVANDFAFVPRLNVEYHFDDLGFGIAASGNLLTVSGKLVRNVVSTAGNGNLIVNNSLEIGVANIVEAVKPFDLTGFRICDGSCLEDFEFVATIGSRYAHVRQHYDASLTVSNGGTANTGSLIANQLYNGFGITSSLTSLYPLTEQLAAYSNVRGSLLIGNDERDSSINITAPMASSATAVTENRTLLMPVGELEIGLIYGFPLAHRGPPQSVAPLLWLKTGFVGQIWGDIGLLRINDTMGNQFSDSHLYLFGFTVQVGLDY
ncbi:MAG: Lpg1974 family pore-forming outer membrane protein [Gemmataceae bacterium]|nr:Lpg1974 family pore-forming outer membrane protein [Gemmataceae bacterium]